MSWPPPLSGGGAGVLLSGGGVGVGLAGVGIGTGTTITGTPGEIPMGLGRFGISSVIVWKPERTAALARAVRVLRMGSPFRLERTGHVWAAGRVVSRCLCIEPPQNQAGKQV